MKKIIAMVAATVVLLTGCGQFGEKSETNSSGAEIQKNELINKNVSEINIKETGGEDGRHNEWIISQTDGCNTVVKTDRMGKKSTYNISDDDFQALAHIDFSDYIGVKADKEYVIYDEIYYNIEIIYDNSTKDIIEVYIPDLWHKLYEIIGAYKPEVELPEPLDTDTDSETPFPETGIIGDYEYRIDNHKWGVFEIGSERGYYFDEENRPDSPLFVYICSGEQTLGADIYISDLSVDADKFIITVTETSPDNAYDAVDWPQCMVEINPKPENVEVKSTNGVKFNYIDMPLYYKEVSEEDILFDEEHNIKYAKNQLLISVFSETNEWLEIERIADEIDAEIVGYIEISGDYQIEFRNDKSLEELETIADYLNSYPFVINVTLNIISEVTTADNQGIDSSAES